jgi:6-pyruvoyltetrahydropterin/6-carboxytetrahydropterin synthase
MITVTRTFSFEAAHHLPNYPGDCKNLHGHTYHGHVTVSREDGKIDKDTGMVMDFKELDSLLETVFLSKFDHSLLNNYFENPTAEIMVDWIFSELSLAMVSNPFVVQCVRLYETDNSYAERVL